MSGFPTWQWQGVADWRPDLISVLVGFVAGIAITIIVYRALPWLLRLRDQSLSRMRETQAWVRAGVEKRFQAETAEYVATFHLGHPWATLAQIFVTPRLLAERPPISPETQTGSATAVLTELWPDLAARIATPPPPHMTVRQLLLRGRRVILANADGAGKTTLLAFCAHLCTQASDTGPYTFLLPKLPIFIHVAELDLTTVEMETDPAGPLARALQRRAGPLTAPGIADLLGEKLGAGHGLLLLDGWDELPPAQRPPITEWLHRLLARYPDTQVIVAAPLAGYGPLLNLDFTLSGLLPWRADQAKQLGTLWAEALAQAQPVAARHYWRPGRDPFAATLHLWQHTLFQDDAPPSERQTELLARTLQAHLPQGDEGRPWSAPAGERLWQRVAYALLDGKRASLIPAELQIYSEEVLAAHNVPANQAGALQKILLDSPLFRKWPDGSISLFTPIWRDFLAAGHLLHAGDHDAILSHLTDPHWAGAVRFYVAQAGERGLTNWLLDTNSTDPLREHLFQVATWLPEAQDQGEWCRQTLIQLGQLVVTAGVPAAVRQRAVAALALTGDAGVFALLRQLLQRSDPALRQAAIAALPQVAPEQAVSLLPKMLKDEDRHARLAAVHALGWLNDPAGENALLTTFIGRDEAMSQAVAVELALNGGENWEILREAATDEALRVRRAATHGLMQLNEYWAVALLEKMAREDDEWVVQSAANVALDTIAERNRPGTWTPTQAGNLTWLVNWAARQEKGVPGGDAALPLLLDLLASPDEQPQIRASAAHSLSRVRLPAAEVPAIASSLKREAHDNANHHAVREAAFAAWVGLDRAYVLE